MTVVPDIAAVDELEEALRAQVAVAREALEEIAGGFFRGFEPWQQAVARQALNRIREVGGA